MSDNDYKVMELFEQLKNDESWESDPQMREMIAMGLSTVLSGLNGSY